MRVAIGYTSRPLPPVTTAQANEMAYLSAWHGACCMGWHVTRWRRRDDDADGLRDADGVGVASAVPVLVASMIVKSRWYSFGHHIYEQYTEDNGNVTNRWVAAIAIPGDTVYGADLEAMARLIRSANRGNEEPR